MERDIARYVATHCLHFILIAIYGIRHVPSLVVTEQDLLAENVPYRLRDTGQGLNRVQAAPRTSRMMHAILTPCAEEMCRYSSTFEILQLCVAPFTFI
jgi:hypothetical protein